jgi:hypothetical protein
MKSFFSSFLRSLSLSLSLSLCWNTCSFDIIIHVNPLIN